MKVFIPVCDDELERLPEDEPLVPYRAGLTLLSQLDVPTAVAPEPVVGPGKAAARPPEESPLRLPCRN